MHRSHAPASSENLVFLMEKFVGGSSRSALQQELRAHGWTWSTRTPNGPRILTRALEARWDSPVFHATRGEVASFHGFLSDTLDAWPRTAEHDRALRLLALVDLAHGSTSGSGITLNGPLARGPFLPCALEALGDPLPLSPVRRAALEAWVLRMGQDPDGRWVARWPETERLPGGLRPPSARAAFFRREFGAETSGGLAGWLAVAQISPPARSDLAHRLDELAPPETHPDWYAHPEARGAYLRLAAAVNPLHAPSRRGEGAPERMVAAWSAGWRPPSPDADPEGWALLKERRAEWAAWLSAAVLGAALPRPVVPHPRSRF